VDVSLGNQRNQRIVVNEGDSPSQLAEEFARTHGKLYGGCKVCLIEAALKELEII